MLVRVAIQLVRVAIQVEKISRQYALTLQILQAFLIHIVPKFSVVWCAGKAKAGGRDHTKTTQE
jgi:hypothetical protein